MGNGKIYVIDSFFYYNSHSKRMCYNQNALLIGLLQSNFCQKHYFFLKQVFIYYIFQKYTKIRQTIN